MERLTVVGIGLEKTGWIAVIVDGKYKDHMDYEPGHIISDWFMYNDRAIKNQ